MPYRYRFETGVLQPEGDWPGIFIRGDDALGYAGRLRILIATLEARAGDLSEEEARAWLRLLDLIDLLESCRVAG